MIWNPNKECMPIEQMRLLQGKRLHKIVEYVYHNVPFYRNKLQEMDLSPEDIQTIDDIVKLPFTTKKDLRDNYPFGNSSYGEGNGNPLQYSCLEKSHGRRSMVGCSPWGR